jgi:glyoxylase-like metal-dependent hydrolase (beta-lactamase superfamily II)
MKRALVAVGILVAALVLVAGALFAPLVLTRRAIVDGFEFRGIRIVKDGFVSVGVVPVGPGQVALVDAGNDADAAAILTELGRQQLGPDAVTAVFLTHGHPDHTAGLARFPKAQVLALRAEIPLIEGRLKARGPLPRLMPLRPTGIAVARALEDGEVAAVGTATVHVFAIPGHTAGSAAYLVDGVLFMGDAVDFGRSSGMTGPPWIFSDDTGQARMSLARLVARLAPAADDPNSPLGVQVIAPSHSAAAAEGLEPLRAFTAER